MTSIESEAFDMRSVIRGYYPSFTPSEKKVADFFLEDKPGILRMTLADVAAECGISDASVLRFCRSMGYKRWLEFKIDLTRSLHRPSEQLLDEVKEDDPPGVLAKKIFQCSIQALTDTIAVIDEANFAKAITMISQAERTLIVGVGTSGPIAQEMFNRFFRLGIDCRVQTDSYLQVMETALLSSRDVVIVISQTGDSTDPIRTIALAKQKGCSVIVITGNSGSKLTKYADVVLLSVSHESRIETMASRIAQYVITHALFVGLMMENVPEAVAKDRLIWDAIMEKSFFQEKNY